MFNKPKRPSEQKIQKQKIDVRLDLPVLEHRRKMYIYKDISCQCNYIRSTGDNNFDETIIKKFCKNSSTKNELKIKSVFKAWERRVVPHQEVTTKRASCTQSVIKPKLLTLGYCTQTLTHYLTSNFVKRYTVSAINTSRKMI